MGILVVDENTMDRESVARILQQAKYRVEQTDDLRSAQLAVERGGKQVIVLGWPSVGGAEFVRRLRTREASGEHAYVIAVLDKQPATDLPALFAAGIDDFARRSVAREELLARVEAPRRVRRWATRCSQNLDVDDWALFTDPRRLRGCQRMGDVVALELEQVVGQPLELAQGWSMGPAEGLRGATICMALASEQAEIRVSILVEHASVSTLCELLLGDANAPEDVMDDVLRELANAAGGAVKREGLQQGVTLTTGIPTNLSRVPPEGDRTRFWVATMRDSGVRIGIVGDVRAEQNQRVAACDLREGMVLASDLRNPTGVLLIASGTRLTATTVDRVRNALGKKTVVDVACAA